MHAEARSLSEWQDCQPQALQIVQQSHFYLSKECISGADALALAQTSHLVLSASKRTVSGKIP